MTPGELQILFESHFEEEYMNFTRVENKMSRRRDLHAFVLLDAAIPGGYCIIDRAEHGEIFLEPTLDQLAAADFTERQVIDLLRCGVSYRDDTLRMGT